MGWGVLAASLGQCPQDVARSIDVVGVESGAGMLVPEARFLGDLGECVPAGAGEVQQR